MITSARSAALNALLAFRKHGSTESICCDREDDTRLAERIYNGVLQNERFLDYCIEQYLSSSLSRLHPRVLDILRISAYQILFLDRVPDSSAVSQAVQMCRASKLGFASGMVNAVLRRISEKKSDLIKAQLRPAIRYSHPDWLEEKLLLDHSTEFISNFMKANQGVAPICLQINTLRTSLQDFLEILHQRGIEPLTIRNDFPSVRIPAMKVTDLPGYREGLFYVQDDAARAAVQMLCLQPGMKVLDACSAPGGKSIAATLAGAEVLSCDLSEMRLRRCAENYRRMNMKIPIRQRDASLFCENDAERYDAVIADVPCSGTGVIRRHPEIRYKDFSEVEKLLPIQAEILDNSARYVKPGGILLYATCSVLREEDEQQIEAFLKRHKEFAMADATISGFDCDGGMLRSWPHLNGNDGFFAAKLIRQENQ